MGIQMLPLIVGAIEDQSDLASPQNDEDEVAEEEPDQDEVDVIELVAEDVAEPVQKQGT
jgi:hypothetical protein